MKRTELLQEIRKMRVKEAYEGRQEGKLTQTEAGQCLKAFPHFYSWFCRDGNAALGR